MVKKLVQKALLAMAVCGILLVSVPGTGSAAVILDPVQVFLGFPNTQMWFFDDLEWGGTPGTHAVATVDFTNSWLFGAELDQYGFPTAFYVWDLLPGGSLYISVYDYLTDSYSDWVAF